MTWNRDNKLYFPDQSSSPVCLGRAERLENDIDNSNIPRDDPGSGYKRTKIHSIVLYEFPRHTEQGPNDPFH